MPREQASGALAQATPKASRVPEVGGGRGVEESGHRRDPSSLRHRRDVARWLHTQRSRAVLREARQQTAVVARDLHDQISRANNSIPSNMVEGFEQSTDRAFACFLTYSKGSLAEVLRRLKQAYFKKYITADELEPRLAAGEELGKMLGGFIKYLRRCGWKDRGSHSEGARGRRKKRTT